MSGRGRFVLAYLQFDRYSISMARHYNDERDAVRAMMERHGMTAAELARKSGVSEAAISRFLAGIDGGNPRLTTWAAIRAALGIKYITT